MQSFFSNNTIASIQNTFKQWKAEIQREENYFLIENSPKVDLSWVVAILQNLEYQPLLSFNKINERYAFTVVPYELPPSFHLKDIQRPIEEVWGVIRAQSALQGKLPSFLPNLEISSVMKQFLRDHPKPGTALDLGCGHGMETLHLLQHQWTVTAVDCNLSAVISLTKNALEYLKSGKLRIKQEKIERLELAEKYDLVVVNSVLSYISPEHFPSVWAKIHRWVKGYLIGNLSVDTPVMSSSECLQKGLWSLRDIHDVTALLRFMKYEIVSCSHSDGMPLTLQLDFTAKV